MRLKTIADEITATHIFKGVNERLKNSFESSSSSAGLVTMQYKWKDGKWKDLRNYPKLYAEYEMIKLRRMYSYEYEFRLK